MKPKFIWEEHHVEAGMLVCRAHRRSGVKWKPDGSEAKWTHKIGFIPGDSSIGKSEGQYCQIAMTDGMVYHRGRTKAEMAADLNEQDMIPMPRAWWRRMVTYLMPQLCPR